MNVDPEAIKHIDEAEVLKAGKRAGRLARTRGGTEFAYDAGYAGPAAGRRRLVPGLLAVRGSPGRDRVLDQEAEHRASRPLPSQSWPSSFTTAARSRFTRVTKSSAQAGDKSRHNPSVIGPG